METLDIEIKRMIEEGIPFKEICKKLDIPIWILHNKRKKMGLSFREKITSVPNLNPSRNLAYIMGLFLGDGTVGKYKSKSGKYTIIVSNISLTSLDKIFVKEFKKAMGKIGLHTSKIKINKTNVKRGGKKSYYSYSGCKEFVEWYEKLTLNDIEKMIENYEIPFLKGFYESEGSYYRQYNNKKKYVAMLNLDVQKIMLASRCLDKIGIFHRVNRVKIGRTSFSYGRKKYYYMIHIRKGDNPQRLIKILKPCIKNK